MTKTFSWFHKDSFLSKGLLRPSCRAGEPRHVSYTGVPFCFTESAEIVVPTWGLVPLWSQRSSAWAANTQPRQNSTSVHPLPGRCSPQPQLSVGAGAITSAATHRILQQRQVRHLFLTETSPLGKRPGSSHPRLFSCTVHSRGEGIGQDCFQLPSHGWEQTLAALATNQRFKIQKNKDTLTAYPYVRILLRRWKEQGLRTNASFSLIPPSTPVKSLVPRFERGSSSNGAM